MFSCYHKESGQPDNLCRRQGSDELWILFNIYCTNWSCIIPLAGINDNIYHILTPPIPGLPLQFILIAANDTNASRIIIGPVGEQFIGMTNFTCQFLQFSPSVESTTVVLTVIG